MARERDDRRNARPVNSSVCGADNSALRGTGIMIQCRRLGHITVQTPDLDRMVEYYQEILGLRVAASTATDAYLVTRVGQIALHLQKGATTRCTRVSFQIAPKVQIAELQAKLKSVGVESDLRSDAVPGITQTLSFTDPAGTALDLFVTADFLPRAGSTGVAPMKAHHAAFVVSDPKRLAQFYSELLGFRVSDWVADLFVFMRCGPDHHTVNFLTGKQTRIHHLAFEMRDSAHLIESCELLGLRKIPIIWGPVRHGPGHNLATYHIAPDGLVVELFCEMDRMVDEELGYFEPRPWHDELPQRPKVWPSGGSRDVWGPPSPPDFINAGVSQTS